MIVYQLRSPSGKSYVGQTIHSFEHRWKQHLRNKKNPYAVHAALKKYGPESFLVQELAHADNQEQLNNLEKLWIILLQSAEPTKGYNLTWGGEGGSHTEATKEKLREAQRHVTNRHHTPETREKIRKGHLGLKFSDEHKKKISLARRGEGNIFAKLTEEQVLAIREEHIPRIVTRAQLGRKYGVTPGIISEIINRKIWKHI